MCGYHTHAQMHPIPSWVVTVWHTGYPLAPSQLLRLCCTFYLECSCLFFLILNHCYSYFKVEYEFCLFCGIRLNTVPSCEPCSWLDSFHLMSLPSTWALEAGWLITQHPTKWLEGRMAPALLVESSKGQTVSTLLDCIISGGNVVFSCHNSNLPSLCFYIYIFTIIVW